MFLITRYQNSSLKWHNGYSGKKNIHGKCLICLYLNCRLSYLSDYNAAASLLLMHHPFLTHWDALGVFWRLRLLYWLALKSYSVRHNMREYRAMRQFCHGIVIQRFDLRVYCFLQNLKTIIKDHKNACLWADTYVHHKKFVSIKLF